MAIVVKFVFTTKIKINKKLIKINSCCFLVNVLSSVVYIVFVLFIEDKFYTISLYTQITKLISCCFKTRMAIGERSLDRSRLLRRAQR